MKNNVLTILMAITLALVCVLVAISVTNSTSVDLAATKDVVSVYGQGKISLKPDVAYLNFGYENVHRDPQKAQDDNSEGIDKIIETLKGKGIEDKDIQTSQYNVDQQYDYINGERIQLGYRVRNIINVKITDVDSVGEIIKAAFEAGGNVFNSVSFDVVQRDEAYLDAMDIAIERAREKADAYALKLGREVVGVVQLEEGGAPTTSSRSQFSNYVALSYARDSLMPEATSAPSENAISSGQIEISATVTVIYELN